MGFAVGGDDAHQADGVRSTGTTVIAGVLFRGRRDLHQSFGFSRAQEGVDRAEAEGIDAHAEVNPPGDQHGDQPTGRPGSRDPEAASRWA